MNAWKYSPERYKQNLIQQRKVDFDTRLKDIRKIHAHSFKTYNLNSFGEKVKKKQIEHFEDINSYDDAIKFEKFAFKMKKYKKPKKYKKNKKSKYVYLASLPVGKRWMKHFEDHRKRLILKDSLNRKLIKYKNRYLGTPLWDKHHRQTLSYKGFKEKNKIKNRGLSPTQSRTKERENWEFFKYIHGHT
jgi:hypothetical protein